MKNKLGLVVVMIMAGVGTYLVGQVWGQQGGVQPPHQPAPVQQRPTVQSKIAFINLGQVIRQYNKFKQMEQQVQTESNAYKTRFDDLQNKLKAAQATLSNPTTPADVKERTMQEGKNIERQLQDLGEEAKTKLAKREFDSLVQTYKEVRDAVKRYAASRGIEIVLHYNDAIGNDEFQPMFFQRKLANGACMPMYMSPGIDVTQDIVGLLNSGVPAAN